jgi:hypothetical protein
MVGGQLHADAWLTVDEHHVPVILGVDGPAEHTRPEAALGREIGGVEHDDLVVDLHRIIVARPT